MNLNSRIVISNHAMQRYWQRVDEMAHHGKVRDIIRRSQTTGKKTIARLMEKCSEKVCQEIRSGKYIYTTSNINRSDGKYKYQDSVIFVLEVKSANSFVLITCFVIHSHIQCRIKEVVS